MSTSQKFYIVLKVSPLDAIKAGGGTLSLDWGALSFKHYLPVFTDRAAAVKHADGDETIVLEAQQKVP